LSQRLETTLLARVPLDSAVRVGGDRGLPVILAAPRSPASQALREAAEAVGAKMRALPTRPAPDNYAPDPELRIIN
jgi:ATP-binding protein involved in chromosome partitioning